MQTIRVTYMTPGFLHKNGGQVGTQTERMFSSLQEAKNAPLPRGCTSGIMQVGDDVWACNLPFSEWAVLSN